MLTFKKQKNNTNWGSLHSVFLAYFEINELAFYNNISCI
jgi:hypothetical protein